MTENKKTTFGAKKPQIKEKPQFEEIAAMWKRYDKYGKEYYSYKLKLTKEIRDYIADTKNIALNHKLFINKRKKENDTQPNYVGFGDKSLQGDK